MSKAGQTGEEIISSLITAVPFQKMSTPQRTDFIDRTFDIKVSETDIIECGDDKDKIVKLILNRKGLV